MRGRKGACVQEREREREWGRARERGRQRIPSRLPTEPKVGLDLTTCEIMTRAKIQGLHSMD